MNRFAIVIITISDNRPVMYMDKTRHFFSDKQHNTMIWLNPPVCHYHFEDGFKKSGQSRLINEIMCGALKKVFVIE